MRGLPSAQRHRGLWSDLSTISPFRSVKGNGTLPSQPKASTTFPTRCVIGSMAAGVIEARDVFKVFVARGERRRRRAFLALHGVNLAIQPGRFVSFVGPSGCGKSTLLNMVAGLVRPTDGAVWYKGAPVLGVNTDVGYITQDDNLLPWRTLLENVEVALEFRGVGAGERRTRAQGFIERVGLSGFEHHYPHELSGGMRKRTALIRTLIYEPDVILMDEPFGPLDAQTRVILQDELLRLW